MEPKDITSKVEEQGQSKLIVSNDKLRNLKSDYFIQKFFGYIPERKSLETIRYNKNLQKRINININHYKAYSEKYSSIELDIIPMKGKCGKFININEEDKKYFHIHFNDNKNETKVFNLPENIKVEKIKVTIDYQVNSFNGLFFYCDNIKSINFIRFSRSNIIDMHSMFNRCKSLKKLNLSNFNTDNVTDMGRMFYGCESLKELNIPNFNTDNVTDMRGMFYRCSNELKNFFKNLIEEKEEEIEEDEEFDDEEDED